MNLNILEIIIVSKVKPIIIRELLTYFKRCNLNSIL